MKKPKKWTEVYAQGTPEGDEEQKFFICLSRDKFFWRSTGQIVKETGLSPKRVDEIINKYLPMNIIFASPSKEAHWGYWERVPEMLKDTSVSLAEADRAKRISRHIKPED
jgi:hypothetical protein